MNSAALESVGWRAQRWLIWLALIFGAQLLLIYLLASHKKTVTPSPFAQRSSIQLFTEPVSDSQFSETFLANDPTLFAMANPNGFSGAAWLKVPKRNYDLSERVESPFWLSLNPEQLGSSVSQFVRSNIIATLASPENIAPKIFASTLLDSADSRKTNSQLRIEGDLASRKLIEHPQLQSWATNGILSNSVVQISVDRRGIVISPRLLSRSDLLEADRAALTLARELRFEPSANPNTTWEKLIFDWHTVPVATTNLPVGNQQ